MKFLVTGGCGFIGSHLCEWLAAGGHHVTILDDFSSGKHENVAHIKGLEIREGSITNAEAFRDIGSFEGVFHLAAIASVERCRQEWYYTHQVNHSGTLNLFAAIGLAGKKIPVVYASSAAVYGDNPLIPLAEYAITEPLSSYGLDKLSCEKTARIAMICHGIPSVGLRFFNVYGPRQDPSSPYSGVVSIFQRKIADKKPIIIYGDGEQTRDFVYVDDIIQSMVKSMECMGVDAGFSEVFNVCTGKQVSVKLLAETLGNIYGYKPEISYAEGRQGDIRHSCGNPQKLYDATGFIPSIPLQEGLKNLV